jgi:uncharacterized membrane protein
VGEEKAPSVEVKPPAAEAKPPVAEASSEEKETARLEAFSDGVFAFAITLLVLELKVPHFEQAGAEPSSTWLAGALLKQWPGYLAYATSFLTILIMWVHHHSVFRLVRRTDLVLLFANGFLLLLVSTVAFPTAIVAEYLTTPAASAAALLYAGQQVLLSLAFYGLLRAAFRPATLSPEAPAETVRRFKRSYAVGPPLYAVNMAVAFFSPKLAMAMALAMWLFWAVTPG